MRLYVYRNETGEVAQTGSYTNPGGSRLGKNSTKSAQKNGPQSGHKTPENPQITSQGQKAQPIPPKHLLETRTEAPEFNHTIDLTPIDGSEDTFGLPGATEATGIAGPPDANGAVAPKNAQNFVPCSYFSCSNGHMWPPEIQVAHCPGCKGPVIGVRFRNCPACNEPGLSWTLRHDRIPVRGNDPLPIAAVCRGQEGPAETQLVDFKMVPEEDPERETPKETE